MIGVKKWIYRDIDVANQYAQHPTSHRALIPEQQDLIPTFPRCQMETHAEMDDVVLCKETQSI